MCHGNRCYYNALHATVHRVLADSLLHSFFPRDGRELEHIQHYVSESVQSCDASKQLLQGEKQQQHYARGNLIEVWKFLFSNQVWVLYFPWEITLFNFVFLSLLRTA
jgi:hypothetical protein